MDENKDYFLQKGINICFLAGKIVSEIKFDFLYNSKKHISIAEFWILPDSDVMRIYTKSNIAQCNIKVRAYDNIADIIYRNFEKNSFISLSGIYTPNYVEAKHVEK